MSGKAHRVFVSFVSEDRRVAEAVQQLLESELDLQGQVFLSADLVAGDDWLAEIRAALESAELLVVMLSARSLKRPWINFESGAAWILKRQIIPVCFGKLQTTALPQPYSTFHAVRLPDEVDRLVKGVHTKLKLSGPSPAGRGLEATGDYLWLELCLKVFNEGA
jgi:hypothetical protein